MSEQIDSLRASASHQQRRLDADQQLLAKGLVSDIAVGETRDALAQAQRQLNAAEQSLDQTRQELASLEARRQDELWQRQQLVSAAQTKRDSLAVALQESVLRAPEDGVVEALTVRVGEVVQAGQPVGKIVPVQSPLVVVSLLAERDRAFAKPGDEVQLELDQLPHAEYGTLRAKVVRIAGDLASPQEIREAFGEEGKPGAPSYRVELEITDASAAEAAKVQLRTGTLMDVRYTLRRQRLITLVFSPLRRWLA
jgi:multidrug resistance efflux pump